MRQANHRPTARAAVKWLVAGATTLGVFRIEGQLWTLHDMNIANETGGGSTLHICVMWLVGALGCGVVKCLVGQEAEQQ